MLVCLPFIPYRIYSRESEPQDLWPLLDLWGVKTETYYVSMRGQSLDLSIIFRILHSPSSLCPSMLSCSAFRPRLVMEENCQLSTSDSWPQLTEGGLTKNDRFWKKGKNRRLKEFSKPRTFSMTWRKNSGGVAYLGVRGQHVVPHDGGPTTW